MIWEETSPAFLWKAVPRRGGGWLSQRDERKWQVAHPRFVIPSAAEGLSCGLENGTYEEVRHSKSFEVRCFPLPSLLFSDRCARKISRFARNDDTGKAFALLPPSSGRRCPEGTEVGSRSGMNGNGVARPSFRHPERSRGIFLAQAVYGMHAAAQKTTRALVSRSPFHRCARKISRCARNDDTGKAVIWEETSPSFLRKEVPRRGGGWLSQRDEKGMGWPILVSSSRAQPRDLSCRLENGSYEEVHHSKSYGVRCFPLPSHLFSDRCARKISRFARNDDTGRLLHFSLLPLEGGAPKGRRLALAAG